MNYDETHRTESSCFDVQCQGSIMENKTLNNCESEDFHNIGLVKVPAVIAEFTVQISVESKIKLPEPVLEIKRIKKNVFLTQCRLIARTNRVFLRGFIRKNIEYATIGCTTQEAICGDIKHATVHIPFECTAEIKCLRPTEFKPNSPVKTINYFNKGNSGVDMNEQDLISVEHFNEKVYCELVRSSIYEADIIEDAKSIECHTGEHEFQCFIEKEVIYLTLKLLQKQQIGKNCEIPEDICDC